MRRISGVLLLTILLLTFTGLSSLNADVITRIKAPSVPDKDKFTFVLFGDTRTSSKADLTKPDNKAYYKLRNMVFSEVRSSLAQKALFTLFTGDMIWQGGDPYYWQEVTKELTPATMKVIYPIMGNHELWYYKKEGDGLANFGKAFPHLKTADGKVLHNYSFELGDNLFINLCSGKYGVPYDKEKALYKWDKEWNCTAASFPQVKAAMTVLIKNFAEKKKNGNIFVQFHKPSFSHYKHPPLNDSNDPTVVLGELKDEYRQLNMYVFNGHNHTTEMYNYKGIWVIVAGGGGAPTPVDYTPYKPPYKPEKELFWAALGIDKTKRPRRVNYFIVDIDKNRKVPVIIGEKCLCKTKKDGKIVFADGCSIFRDKIRLNPAHKDYDADLNNFIKDFE